MLRSIVLVSGILLAFLHVWIFPLPSGLQWGLFLAGILTLGVPHGAADLLVAKGNAGGDGGSSFSIRSFLVSYVARLAAFGLFLWIFPPGGIALFILFAAYHFGETDLAHVDTGHAAGKYLVVSYGLPILGMMLLFHTGDLSPFVQLLKPAPWVLGFLELVDRWKAPLLCLLLANLLAASAFVHLRYPGERPLFRPAAWLQYAVLLFILHRMPLILGFTFYFIGWHSIFSLLNIFRYLHRLKGYPIASVWKQVGLFSAIAVAGTVMVGAAGFMFVDRMSVVWYALMSLAVLTVPHMEVMHDMYHRLRSERFRTWP